MVRELERQAVAVQALEKVDLFVRRNAQAAVEPEVVDARTDRAVAVVEAGEGGAFGGLADLAGEVLIDPDDRMAHRRTQILVPVPGRCRAGGRPR